MKRRRKSGTGIGIIAFVVFTFCGIIAYSKVDLIKRQEQLESKKKILDSQIQEEDEREIEYENLKAYVQTKKYVEEVAREKLGLVYEDEILFKKNEEK